MGWAEMSINDLLLIADRNLMPESKGDKPQIFFLFYFEDKFHSAYLLTTNFFKHSTNWHINLNKSKQKGKWVTININILNFGLHVPLLYYCCITYIVAVSSDNGIESLLLFWCIYTSSLIRKLIKINKNYSKFKWNWNCLHIWTSSHLHLNWNWGL